MKKYLALITLLLHRFRNRRFLQRMGKNWWELRLKVPKRRGESAAVIPGGFANDPSSELYIRPDKDHPAREWKWSYRRLERLVDKGRTKPFSRAEMRMYRDRLAYYNRRYGEA